MGTLSEVPLSERLFGSSKIDYLVQLAARYNDNNNCLFSPKIESDAHITCMEDI